MIDRKHIEVVPYDAAWPQMFEGEAARIKQALGDNCLEVHHIGSTAVPGLRAKPIIDMIPVVHDIMKVDQAIASMEALGYEAQGEFGILFRRYFQKGSGKRTHNVHIFEIDSSEVEKHLICRDWMRSHEEDREKYAQLKQQLALQFPHDTMAYSLGKNDFIKDILRKAKYKGLTIVLCLHEGEWAAAKAMRQKYFFDKVPMKDPYGWTFDHPDHKHLVLYQGTEIVGYAHIQLWPNQRAALRIIVIDEPFRNEGLGAFFLAQCEKWLKQQGYNVLHTEASPDALPFYEKHGYIPMPFNDPDGYESDPRDIPVGKHL
jgi:GrpB-like predicted nucleotidyltransferase (UPF0157 family)/GNAT superfamily N-acetyltransferase